MIKGIQFATQNGAHIINASLGATNFDTGLQNAITAFTDAGGILITAAGNNNNNNDNTPIYPCNFNATNPNIICVAAHNDTNTLARYSNYGQHIDISAPGTNIHSTVKKDSYGNMDGTSMATPHVVGAFSLLWNYRPDLTALDIKQALFSGAEKLSSGKSIKGEKRLNLFSSLKLLDNTPPTLLETPLIDTDNYCDTQHITYMFTGTDDIQLDSMPYSFDNGATRQMENSLSTGTVLTT
jgi:subtilisin family serine protease